MQPLNDKQTTTILRQCPGHGPILLADAGRQLLRIYLEGSLRLETPISTSARGLGCENESFRTPTGWHRISERIGGHQNLGQMFVSREPVGAPLPPVAWQETTGAEQILSCILWLDGLEAHNHTSHERYIYLHGTNQEPLLGTPASRGCIRLGNQSICEIEVLLRPYPDVYCWVGELSN